MCKYCHFPIGMAGNGSECATFETQMRVINIMYASLSFLSFVPGLIALVLNRCYYCRHKDRHQTDSMEEIFIIVLAISSVFEFSESFQWFALFDDFVGCAVLGVIREYTLISLLVIMVCLGTHLLILMTKPKCLQVINEVKLKRYKIIQKIYVIVSFLVPIVFVPWPFISVQYGNQGDMCWLRDPSSCGDSSLSITISWLLMWHIWALLVWLYIVAVFAYTFYTYCSHKRSTTKKLDLNSITIILILTVYLVELAFSFSALLHRWTKKTQYSITLKVLVAVLTPLTLMIFFIILIIRQVCIIRMAQHKHKSGEIVSNTDMTAATYQTFSEGVPVSRSTYYDLPKDEWDT